MSAPGSLRPSVSPDGPQVVIGIAPPSIVPDEHDEGMIAESRREPEASTERASVRVETPVETPVETAIEGTLEQRSVERDGLVAVHHVGAMQRQAAFTVESVTSEPETDGAPSDDDDVPTPPPVEAAARLDSDPPAAPAGKILDPDEISIPPIGDLHEDQFFSDGERVVHAVLSQEEEWDLSKVKSQRKAAPEVVERRHRFTRWVRWAVAGAAVLCLAATVRTVATKPAPVSVPKAAAAQVVKVEAPKAEAPKAEAPKAEAPKAEAVTPGTAPEAQTAAPAKAEEPKAEPAADKVEAKADAPKAAPTEDDLKAAVTQKRAAQNALERSKLDDAIAAGEKAVELNPADGESWLILGASYQQKGKLPEARKAFKACTEQGKKGPIGECRAMLRF